MKDKIKIRHLGTGGLESSHMGIPDSKLAEEIDAIETDLLSDGLPEETDCTPEEAREILNSVELPDIKSGLEIYDYEEALKTMEKEYKESLSNRDKFYPEQIRPFKQSELDKLDKKFYIPKAVYTNIKTNNYKTQKNLQLKTIEGIDNINNYHRVYLTVEVPNEKLTLDPNELYNILTNCGVSTSTAETAIKTAMESKQ